ncbi:MAG: TldD/PmbA family protein [archaeon]
MDRDLADFAVEASLKAGASYAEARLESSTSTGFLLKNGIPQVSCFDRATGLGMRIIVNKSLGFVSTNVLNKERIRALIDKAVGTAKSASRITEPVELSAESPHKDSYKVRQKTSILDVSAEEKLGHLMEIDKALLSCKASVPGRYLSLSDNLKKKYLVTSEGTQIYSEIPRTNFYYFITVEENNKSAQRYWQCGQAAGWESVINWDLRARLTNEALATRENLKNGVRPPKGNLDIVAAPEVTSIIVHESGGHPYEADRILGREAAQAGESFITKDLLGKRIGTDVVTVVDDPTVENSNGFYLYDDEGVRARRKILIKNGIMNELLHNRETSHVMGIKSNGSSRANSYDREAIIRMSNTFMVPGDHSEEELIEGVKLGVYMKNFMEWNIDDKRIHQKYVGAEAYLIRNGRLAEPVSNPALEISTEKLYSAIDAVAENLEFSAGTCGKAEPMQAIPVWFGGPSIRLRNIRLG